MSDLPEVEEIETTQVPAWRCKGLTTSFQFWSSAWRAEREKDLQDVRTMLSHLAKYEDWFFVNVNDYDVDVFFTDPRQAMLFKLRHTV